MTRTRKLILAMLIVALCLSLVATAFLTFGGNVAAEDDAVGSVVITTEEVFKHDDWMHGEDGDATAL